MSPSESSKVQLHPQHEHDPEHGNTERQLDTIPPVNERRLMWKIDFHLVPPLCLLYILAFLDRVNIANARLFSLEKDLNLTGNQYNICLVIFFVPYVIFEIPANYLLKKFRPSIWLPFLMFCFGLVMALQGATSNFSGLVATRFFLGLAEAGTFPGCFYLLSMWYKRNEAQKRFSLFFCSTTLAGATGGLLASAIGNMDGILGHSGWRWIFILEGVATCLISFGLHFFIADFPEEAKFLNDNERQFIISKLKDDAGDSEYENLKWRNIVSVFKDWKIWMGGFMYFGLIVPCYGIAYFAPTIIKQLGYTSFRANILSAPPWAVALVFAMLTATISDYFSHRFSFVIVSTLIGILGFILLLVPNLSAGLYYGSLFCAVAGTYAAMPITICWFLANLGGHHKRSVGSAWQIGFGNIGGIIVTYVFLPETAPRFVLGKAFCIACMVMCIVVCCVYFVGCLAENKRKDRRAVNGQDGKTEEGGKKGEEHPDFRFIL